jgi:hypothetical protein
VLPTAPFLGESKRRVTHSGTSMRHTKTVQ